MTDIERLLRDSLARSAEAHVPVDVDAAEQRFLQRRGRRRIIRAAGGAVLAAAAVAAVFALARTEVVAPPQPRLEPAGIRVAQRSEVPEEPLALAADATTIWVASRGAGIVSRIDPARGDSEEIELEKASQVVAVAGGAWAAADGRVVEIRSGTGAGSMVIDWPPDPVDMAAARDGKGPVWVVTSSGCVADVTRLDSDRVCLGPRDLHATDVTATAGETWLLDGEAGELHQLHAEPGVNAGRAWLDGDGSLPPAPAGRYADLLLSPVGGRDILWVSGEEGRLLRLDLSSGQATTTRLPGDYVDLAEGYGGLWALLGREGSERGDVVELDLETGEPVGSPVVLSGKPSDIAAGPSGVWVTLRNADQVVQITGPGS